MTVAQVTILSAEADRGGERREQRRQASLQDLQQWLGVQPEPGE
jgi:hypothetical protein